MAEGGDRAVALREEGRRKLRDGNYEAAAKDFSDALTAMYEPHHGPGPFWNPAR